MGGRLPTTPIANAHGTWRELVWFGGALGALLLALHFAEVHVTSFGGGLYAGVIALVFAALGLVFGLRERRPPPPAGAPEPATTLAASVARDLDPGARETAREAARTASGITPRELEILEGIAAGLSNREIGERLFVSEHTVKTHASRLLAKLGARRRTEAIRIAQGRGLLVP
jgi:DNA-binding CsgD family transcriptional regulator